MFESNNIYYFLIALIPALVYSFMIYLSSRYKSISLKRGISYLILGGLSVTFVNIVHFIFPMWLSWNISSQSALFAVLFKVIIQVALLEEMCKYLSFRSIKSLRHRMDLKRDKPVATMFYACMVSVGFAVIENIYYAVECDHNPAGLLVI